MSNFYDEEDVIRSLENLYKSELNDEIAAVNTEKADSIVLTDIPTDSYIFETLSSKVLNIADYWLQYGLVENAPTEIQDDNFLEPVTVTIQAATIDNGEEDRGETIYRLLRYRKAIKRVLLNNLDVFSGYSRPQISSLKPAAFPYDNRVVILSAGINVTASITAN